MDVHSAAPVPASMARSSTAYHAVHLTESPARRAVWRAIARYLAPWMPPGGRVLEIGAGYCDWINQVAGASTRVAVDLWPGVRERVADGVRAVVLDVTADLPTLGAASFDAVLASNVLEHFPPDTGAVVVGDIHALLAPGGRLIVIQPNFRYAWRQYFDDYTHRAVFTDVSLPALLRAHGFRIDVLQPRFLPYSMRDTRLPLRTWLVAAYLRSPVKPWAGQMLVIATKG